MNEQDNAVLLPGIERAAQWHEQQAAHHHELAAGHEKTYRATKGSKAELTHLDRWVHAQTSEANHLGYAAVLRSLATAAEPYVAPKPGQGVSSNPYCNDADCNEPSSRAMRWRNELLAGPAVPATQAQGEACNFPMCQSDAEQARIAADVHAQLYGAGTQAQPSGGALSERELCDLVREACHGEITREGSMPNGRFILSSEELRSLLATPPTGGALSVPIGWKLMPRVPTAMHVGEAYYQINRKYNKDVVSMELLRECYVAMIYALPPAPTPPAPGENESATYRMDEIICEITGDEGESGEDCFDFMRRALAELMAYRQKGEAAAIAKAEKGGAD